MENEAPFTVGTDVNAQPRDRPVASSQDSSKNSVQMHVNDQTPLLQRTREVPGLGDSRPNDGTIDSEPEPRKAWKNANVSHILLFAMTHNNYIN